MPSSCTMTTPSRSSAQASVRASAWPSGVRRRVETARAESTRRYVLLAPDVLDRHAKFLQQGEVGVDHVGIAAQISDIVLGVRCEFGQRVLHMAAAIVRARRGARGA